MHGEAETMRVHLGPYTFDHVTYDAEGDVLYLAIGEPRDAADSEETPEGHVVRYDDQDRVIGVSLVNVNWLLDHRGALVVTLPRRPVTADVGERCSAPARLRHAGLARGSSEAGPDSRPC